MNSDEGLIDAELTNPSLKLNLSLLDKKVLGIPGIPCCLFIYKFVSREDCGCIIKASRLVVCHTAQKALIAEVLL